LNGELLYYASLILNINSI